MMLNDKEIARLTKNLKDYYMGELIPPPEAIRGYYDREIWEVSDPCTMYAEEHGCVECYVEYIHYENAKYLAENVLAAHITLYVGDGQFFKTVECWAADDVRRFKNEIVITK